MATEASFTVPELNDLTLTGTFTTDTALATPATARLIVKASKATADGSADIDNEVSATVDGTTVTATWTVADTALPGPGTHWHRIDLIDSGGLIYTARYGPFVVTDT